MTATDAPLTLRSTPAAMPTGTRKEATVGSRDGLGGGRQFVSDVESALADARVALDVADDAYERVVAQVLGVPRAQQSFLLKLIATGALGAVLASLAPRLRPIRPSGADAAIGASMLNTALSGIAGAPSGTIPAAGALIGFAVLAHALGSVAGRSSRDLHARVRKAELRYGRRHGTSVATRG